MIKTICFDTSVLVAALIQKHSFHEVCASWLQDVHQEQIKGVISSHTLAELYSTLTTLPIRPRISPQTTKQLLEHNIYPVFDFISLDGRHYKELIVDTANQFQTGGLIYDGIIGLSAKQADADILLTLNRQDFRRFDWLEIEVKQP